MLIEIGQAYDTLLIKLALAGFYEQGELVKLSKKKFLLAFEELPNSTSTTT